MRHKDITYDWDDKWFGSQEVKKKINLTHWKGLCDVGGLIAETREEGPNLRLTQIVAESSDLIVFLSQALGFIPANQKII
jgi:hypothetical protein